MKSAKINDLISEKITGEWGSEVSDNNGVNVLRTTNFTNRGVVNYSSVVRRQIGASLIAKKRLLPGDIIIEKSGGGPKQPVGRVVYFDLNVDEPYLCNNFTSVLRPNSLKVDSKYLFYSLFYKHITDVTLRYQNKTTGIINLKLERYLEDELIPLPPLPAQQKIASILEKADAARQKRAETLKLTEQFLQSAFLDMFGDPEENPNNFPFIELEKLCSIIVDCPHSTPIKANRITNFPCIRTSELTRGYISWDSMQYLEETEYKKRTLRLIPEKGDIVYGREGTYGEAVVIPSNYKFSLGQRTMLFRPDFKKTNSIYLWAIVRSDFVYRQAKKKNRSSTVGHVNVKDIKQFRILNPPLPIQQKFANLVEKVEKLREKQRQSEAELELLFQSLMQRAFNGELVREEVEQSAS